MFSNFIKGILIGAGAILPGISSGVICVVFGLYQKLLDSILGFFKNIRQNLKFLLPILLGIFVGILIFSKILNYMLYNFPTQTKSAFVGMILTTIPSLLKDINKKSNFRIKYLFFLIISLILGIALTYLEKHINIISPLEFNYYYLILCGFLMSIGIIVPGISSTVILMLLGVYSTYLNSISNLYLPILIPIGIGIIIGAIIFMKITKYFLDNHYIETFYIITGFTLGSILIIWPDFSPDLNGVLSFICMMIGPILSICSKEQ